MIIDKDKVIKKQNLEIDYFKRLLSEGGSGLLLDELESVKLNLIDLKISFNELSDDYTNFEEFKEELFI